VGGAASAGALDDLAVAHRDDALRDARHPALVGDDHQRHAVVLVELLEELDDLGPVAESRLPVGSSHRSSLGRPNSARAMATRCF
jgi:hypothetical protein